jgi:BASS family bile acid:Na+ symporter
VFSTLRILGLWARWALPLGVCVGLVWPALAHTLQPLLPAAVIATLTASLLRLDWQDLAHWLKHPKLPLLLVAVQLLVSPGTIWLLASVDLIPERLVVISVLQAAGAPIGSAAAFALFLGLPGHLIMVGAVLSTLLLPVTLSLTVALLLPAFGIEVALGPFVARVTLYAVAPFLLAALLRRMIGLKRLQARDGELAGLNVLALLVFAIAIMDGVTAAFVDDPVTILTLLGWSLLATLSLHFAGYLGFRHMGLETAMAAALMLGNRNMGLLLVVTAGTAGPLFQMYCGLAQIPMYCVPLVLGPLLRRLRR